MYYYLLFSDGAWVKAETYEDVNKIIKSHWWPFPLDIKGDPRRTVRIITEIGIEEVRKSI